MATAGPEVSLQNLIDKFHLSQDQLDKEVSEEHLRKVSRIIDDHEVVGYELELTESEMTAINHDKTTQERQRLAMLRQWKRKVSWKATYGKLIEALLECHRANHAREVCELLSQSEEVQERMGDIKSLQNQLQQKEGEIENLQNQLQEKERETQDMASENRDIQRENESLRKEAQSLWCQILQKEGEVTKMKEEIEHFQNKLHVPQTNGPSDYYDILLLGKTGMGKSTTGNKLLGINIEGCGPIRVWSTGEDAVKYFKTGVDCEPVTKECKLLSNTRGIRVLDPPGFADFELTREVGVMQSNLQVLRWILRMQVKHNLVFHRVLYFLPNRGVLERADGTLQEQIKVMYEFLGMDVFNIMVIIATNMKGKYQRIGFDEGDIEQIESAFIAAFTKIIDQHLPKCPPVLYLPFNEADMLVKINSAAVIHERPIKAQIFDVSKRSEIDTVIRNDSGGWPYFRVSCNRCTGKLICETSFLTGKEATMIGCEGENGVLMTRSKCHPIMIPKHRAVSKIVGGIAHVATLGIPAIIGEATGNKVWPGFANSDAYCPVCGQPPGSYGCTDVGEEVEIKGTCITVSHSTFIDEIVETDFSFYN